MVLEAPAAPRAGSLSSREEGIDEVRCSECGAIMPMIPSWYARVRVRFTCDNCRQKSSRLAPIPTLAEAEARAALERDGDSDVEPAIDDLVDVDDISVDVVDIDEELGDTEE